MHIMAKKGTCAGREARINKLLLKKPPGMMNADGASLVCKQDTNGPLKAVREKKGRRRKI